MPFLLLRALQNPPPNDPKVFSMSTRDDAAAAQRATWTRGEELALLERYFEARKDPSKATDKGVKSKAWEEIKITLSTKLKKTLDKGNGSFLAKILRFLCSFNRAIQVQGAASDARLRFIQGDYVAEWMRYLPSNGETSS